MGSETEHDLREQIHYDLAYYGIERETETSIVEAIARLPEDVRGFALEQCLFFSVGRTALGQYAQLSGTIEGMWVVNIAEQLSPDDKESAVAHEIAHCWLGHTQLNPKEDAEREEEACTLVREWGFGDIGATVRTWEEVED